MILFNITKGSKLNVNKGKKIFRALVILNKVTVSSNY